MADGYLLDIEIRRGGAALLQQHIVAFGEPVHAVDFDSLDGTALVEVEDLG